MSEQPTAPKTEPKQQPKPERGIPVALLLIDRPNPHGPRLPTPSGDKQEGKIVAGMAGDIKTVIEYRPWMRHHRVARFRRLDGGTGQKDRYEKHGEAFFIPETWCVFVPVEE